MRLVGTTRAKRHAVGLFSRLWAYGPTARRPELGGMRLVCVVGSGPMAQPQADQSGENTWLVCSAGFEPMAQPREHQSKGKWCPGADSNHRHRDFQSRALPTELPGHVSIAIAKSQTTHTKRPYRKCFGLAQAGSVIENDLNALLCSCLETRVSSGRLHNAACAHDAPSIRWLGLDGNFSSA